MRRPASLPTEDRHFELEGTSISPSPRAFARSWRDDLGARPDRPTDSWSSCSCVSRRGVPGARRIGPPRSHTCARAKSTAERHLGLPLRCSLARPRLGSSGLGGRGNGSLPSVLGFHLDWQTVGGRRAKIARSFEREGVPSPWSAGPFTRAPRQDGSRGSAGQSAARRAPADAPGAPEAGLAGTSSEEDAELLTHRGGRSGQHAVKQAAHAPRLVPRRGGRDEISGAL